jgi:hypothetical protein
MDNETLFTTIQVLILYAALFAGNLYTYLSDKKKEIESKWHLFFSIASLIIFILTLSIFVL